MLPRLPPHLRVDRELSAGRTWLVRDVHSGDSFIVKKCSGAAPSLMRRWRQVARRADGHIVIERDLFVREDGVVAIRPYVNGQPLQQLRNAPFERATEMLLAIAFDLEGLHRRRIVHGNLHANNIIVDAAGRPRLVDCLETGATDGNAIVAAPEQLRGRRPTARSDIHALGVVAFELVVGRTPFSGPRRLEAIQQALYDEPSLSPEEERALPRGLAEILRKAMAKNESSRFSSAEQFAIELHKLAPGVAREHARYPRRAPEAIAIAAARRLAPVARRFWQLPPRLRIGLAVAAVAVTLGSWAAASRSHTRSLERHVEALLTTGDATRARRLVTADERSHGHLPVHDKLLGDVGCAQGDQDECIRRYERALRQSSRYSSDGRLRRNALAMLPREDRSGAIAVLLAKLDGIEGALAEATRGEHYWKRWNAVHALERRGAHGDIDYVQVHAQDLLHAGSCSTRKAALSRLMQRGDRAALQVLEQARAQPEASQCLGEDLLRAIEALASAR